MITADEVELLMGAVAEVLKGERDEMRAWATERFAPLAPDDFDLTLSDDERSLTMSLKRGGKTVSRTVTLSHPLYRGVWENGHRYRRGDAVTFGGSVFIATCDTTDKPETSAAFTLAVKRGRDGKDTKQW